MPDYRKYAGLLILACIFVLLVGAVAPLPDKTFLARSLQNASHPLGFAVFGALLGALFPPKHSDRANLQQLLCVAAGIVLVALGTEAVQLLLPHRSASGDDLMADLLGGAAGAGLVWCVLIRRLRPRLVTFGVTSLCLALAFWPVRHLPLIWLAQPSFPTLVDASAILAAWHMRANHGASVSLSRDGVAPSLKVELLSSRAPGARLVDAAPDWSSCSHLIIEARSGDNAPMKMLLRARDQRHSSESHSLYRTEFTVSAERTIVEIPLADLKPAGRTPKDQSLKTSEVADVVLYTREDNIGRQYHLYHMSLHCSV